MKIEENFPLAPLTTLKVGGPAKYFAEVSAPEEIGEALKFAKEKDLPTLILGGGSNIVISDSGFPGLVIRLNLKGIKKLDDSAEAVLVEVAAGENWDEFVKKTAHEGYWGLENLSHIPGLAGAVAVQNVGAYGAEASQVIESVKVFDTFENRVRELNNPDCDFGYRKSVFNSGAPGRYVILAITFRLSKKPRPNLKYVDLIYYFSDKKIAEPSQIDIRNAVIEIRNRKFPFPKAAKDGNVGSFFKNLKLTAEEYDRLKDLLAKNFDKKWQEELERIRHKFPDTSGIKIPTAFLIEACGLKGFELSGVKVNDNHPLVLLNLGQATAKGVMEMFRAIRRTVFSKTGLEIKNEPEFIGFSTEELDHYFSLK